MGALRLQAKIGMPGPRLCDDFQLRFRGTSHEISSIIALQLSRRLQIEQLSDFLLSAFTIPDDFPFSGIELIAQFLRGSEVFVSEAQLPEFVILAIYLEIVPQAIGSPLSIEKMTPNELFAAAQWLFRHGSDVHSVIAAIKSKFSAESLIENETFQQFDPDLIFWILLAINQQSSKLSKFILARGGRLLQLLDLSTLSPEELVDVINNSNLNWLRWSLVDFFKSQKEDDRVGMRRFGFLGDNPLKGILFEMQSCCLDFLTKTDIISLSSSPSLSSEQTLHRIFEPFDERTAFCSRVTGSEKVFFIIDFLRPIIELDGYTIRGAAPEDMLVSPSDWRITGQGSSGWILVDERRGVELGRVPNRCLTVTLPRKTPKLRRVKFEHELVPVATSRAIAISAFEIFGWVAADACPFAAPGGV
jgi:hypothetical protein